MIYTLFDLGFHSGSPVRITATFVRNGSRLDDHRFCAYLIRTDPKATRLVIFDSHASKEEELEFTAFKVMWERFRQFGKKARERLGCSESEERIIVHR